MKIGCLWPFLSLALAWQCWGIEINVDTVFSAGPQGDTTACFTIKNTSAIETVYVDSIYIYKLSPLVICSDIAFQDPAHVAFCVDVISPLKTTTDSVYIATKVWGCYSSYLTIAPHDSLMLKNVQVGECLGCVGVQANSYNDQCILKAIFVPNNGARDSVVLIGPRISGGTKSPIRSKIVVSGKASSSMKLYDLSGRRIDKVSIRKSGVYISTYGVGILEKKVIFGD
jgi:hypothetical protein